MHDNCYMYITYDLFALQLLYVHYAWQEILIRVHGRWYSSVYAHGHRYLNVPYAVCIWPLLAVQVGWCLCMTAAVCTWQMLYKHGIWYMCRTTYVCAWPLLPVVYMTDVVYAWPMIHVRYNLWMCMSATCLCMTAAVIPWLLLSVHDKSCVLSVAWVLGKCKANLGYLYVHCDYV